jgi:hypothetical protein|tara:strand:+ start:257 stop:565 length:309 start_codon:yes stop_codon:yes gene_type:complete
MDFLVDKRSIYVSQMIRAANIDEEQLFASLTWNMKDLANAWVEELEIGMDGYSHLEESVVTAFQDFVEDHSDEIGQTLIDRSIEKGWDVLEVMVAQKAERGN